MCGKNFAVFDVLTFFFEIVVKAKILESSLISKLKHKRIFRQKKKAIT